MEDFVAAVKVYSQDKNWTALKTYINESAGVLAKNASRTDSALAALDPEQNTLGFMGLLFFKISLPSYGDFELLVTQFEQFLQLCSKEQVQHGIDKFCIICHFLTNCFIENNQALRGINMLVVAVEKCQRHTGDLTSVHADLMQLCLKAKCFKPALAFLNSDITDINNEFGQYDSKAFLLYYYYGGMIYLALKQYHKALCCFEVAVTTPAMAVSHIMREAHRKFILVSIFLHGKVIPLPKYVSAIVPRALKPMNVPYTELAEAYQTHDPDRVRACVNKHQQVFQRHNNSGLVKQVISSLTKSNIQRLTKTFITLSLSDMAARVKLRDAREAESYILEMIEDGSIYASINQPAGMVSFHNSPESFSSPEMLSCIDSEMRKCVVLNEHILQLDRELSVNPQYVQRVMNVAHMDDAGKGDELLM